MPFAQRSNGIAAEHGPVNKPSVEHYAMNKHTQTQTAAARIARICHRKGFPTPSSNIKLAYDVDVSVHSKWQPKKSTDLTLFSDHLPPTAANGHNMWVGGDSCNPWIWCVNCWAYSNKVVKKLAEQCKGSGNMFAVNTLMQGYHPCTNKEKRATHQHAPNDVHTLAYHFQNPATNESDKVKVLSAAVNIHNPKDKRLGNKWQSIMQRVNIRLAPRIRYCNPMQAKKQHDEGRTTQMQAPPIRPQLANAPRRLVWADIGGRPHAMIVVATQNRATAIAAAKQVCIAAYANAHRKQRKEAIIAQRRTKG